MMNKVFNHLLRVTYRYTKLILLCNILILYKNLHMHVQVIFCFEIHNNCIYNFFLME